MSTSAEKGKNVLVCPNCGGQLELVEEFSNIAECQYCGTQIELSESDAVRIQSLKTKEEMGKQKIESERMHHSFEQEEKAERERRINDFKRGKLKFAIIGFGLLSAFCCMVDLSVELGDKPQGIVALVQAVLCAISILMGLGVIKEKRPNLHVVAFIIAIILIVPFWALQGVEFGGEDDSSSTVVEEEEEQPIDLNWDDFKLANVLPAPAITNGIEEVNTEKKLDVTIYGVKEADYDSYLKNCEKEGFGIDKRQQDGRDISFNEEGYKLSLFYNDDDEHMAITLDAPIDLGDIKWPNKGVAKTLPEPNSSYGRITTEDSDSFTAYVGNVTYDEYKEYVDKCLDKGYDVDYSKYDYSFFAENKDEYDLEVKYYGNDIMFIQLIDWGFDDDDDDDSWF